jgi:hypothetical protein
MYRGFWKFEKLFFVFGGQISLWAISRDILRGPQLFDPLKISLEMAHKVICPPKKNNIPHFQNQRYINFLYDTWIWIQGQTILFIQQFHDHARWETQMSDLFIFSIETASLPVPYLSTYVPDLEYIVMDYDPNLGSWS